MASLPTSITIELDSKIADQIAERLRRDRETLMAFCHGEVCTKSEAAKILKVTPRTICQMVHDGRILTACGGDRIDTRSMARYIENRGERDHEARMEKKRRRNA